MINMNHRFSVILLLVITITLFLLSSANSSTNTPYDTAVKNTIQNSQVSRITRLEELVLELEEKNNKIFTEIGKQLNGIKIAIVLAWLIAFFNFLYMVYYVNKKLSKG